MKKTLLSIAATAALAGAALPAAAQTWHGDRPFEHDRYAASRSALRDVEALDRRIQRAAETRRIGWSEARALRRQLDEVRPIARRANGGRVSDWELRRLDQTLDRVERAVSRATYADRRFDDHDRRR